MAKLKVSQELLAQVLFGDVDVDITGARMIRDTRGFQGQVLELEVSGPSVPNVEDVVAEIQQFENGGRITRFKALI